VLTAGSLALSLVCLGVSLIPILPAPHGLVRMFDFGRMQVIALAVVAMGLALASGPLTATAAAAIALAVGAVLIQLAHVLPFAPVWSRQTRTFDGDVGNAAMLSLLVCNVKQGNRQYERIVKLLAECSPDIAVFMETDAGWADALRPYLSGYADIVEQPQSNTYGMILASRLPLRESAVDFLLNEEVPSITCVVCLPGGKLVRVIALHPEPPLPIRDTLGRDAEILMVAERARKDLLPLIVTGDLNDVAWSPTTRRFLRISGLLDPRQGRGLFNTFDARYWFLRWPLDHIFHSTEFELVTIERQRFVGSDHFPMFYRLALTDVGRNRPPSQPSADDLREADRAIDTELGRNRRPAGANWES
jgi:endonuclease/exonuclease/phosphatase (EEP) superfamily protein YafD